MKACSMIIKKKNNIKYIFFEYRLYVQTILSCLEFELLNENEKVQKLD
jgi:hypothetical protein